MIASDLHARLELILGDCCPLPAVPSVRGVIAATVSAESFTRLVKHWRALPAGSRPRLRGLSLSREPAVSRRVQLVIDVGGANPFLLLSTDWAPHRPIPTLGEIWPYARWWEEEIRCFERIAVEAGPESQSKHKEVQWRQN